MAEEILLPKFGNTVEECIIKQWSKSIGDAVEIGDVLCEVETDKTTMDVPSTAQGVIRHVFYQHDDVVKVRTPIAIVGSLDENIEELLYKYSQMRSSVDEEDILSHEISEISKDEKFDVTQKNLQAERKITGELVFSPRAHQYLARKGLSAKSFVDHFLFENFYKGNKNIVEEKDVASFFKSIAPISTAAIEALIKQNKVLTITYGSGIGSRIITEDIDALTNTVKSVSRKSSLGAIVGMEEFTEKERNSMVGMRKIIAERMVHSLQNTAQVTLTMQAHAASIQNIRNEYKNENKPFTINDILLYLVARVLIEHSWANSILENNEVISYNDVNLGCAVQTSNGLLVPVIKQAAKKSILQIHDDVRTLSKQCKEGKISPEHLQGGTFTLTNLGAMGIGFFTPILNAPQTGILGIGSIEMKVLQTDAGNIVFEPFVHLSLTFDHRAYDGMDAALLLRLFADAIALATKKTIEE